ncbi:hypothetical protein VSH64_41455 [Amycolatopsis rhabdoformis]|uniref:Lipoprotein n=1 Tax=Amycolatopsis rhabdoformis TaxID=1448059 RepID=A0ABZ1I5G9_9PSEU|nr:hypothetical protein [Amycolatopsis rhabdoformis]WSE29211.1 hypothetical protein VSH64_41455 [Amycolatopsis rhabdoformis]
MRRYPIVAVVAGALIGSACSAPAPPSPAQPAAPRQPSPVSSAPPVDPHARQWVDDFCTRPRSTEQYLSFLPDATDLYPTSTPSEMEATRAIAAQSVQSVATFLRENAAQVASAPAGAVRDRLTAIYTQLNASLDQAQQTTQHLPTTDYDQFKRALHAAADEVHADVERARQAIEADPDLGGFLADHPICS